MTSSPTIITAINDPELFRPLFKDLKTWTAWITLLKALFGLEMTRKERKLYRRCTGRKKTPQGPFKELWAIVGRRGGKSFVAAVTAVFLALFYDYSRYLSPGERAVIQILAVDRAQVQVILKYISAILHSSKTFEQYILNETKDAIELTTSVDIEVTTCSFRSLRGRTLAVAICDEVAFWRTIETGANPDKEVLRAIRPAMATIPTSMLLVLSSPYARAGALYEAHRDYYGKDDPDVLVWQAETRLMNPTISKELIKKETKKDPVAAASEWGARFRKDVESYVSREVIEGCVVKNRRELPSFTNTKYTAFCDPAGGSGTDSMTLAISHTENDIKVLDLLREIKPPFSPREAVAEFASILHRYRISTVTGDKYASEWPRERFREHGITYQVSPKNKSELYRDFLPLLNSGQVELLDNDTLVNQLLGLERSTGRGGRDSIDHLRGGHDDTCNVAAGVLVGGKVGVIPRVGMVNTDEPMLKPLLKEKPPEGDYIEVWGGTGLEGYERITPQRMPRIPFDDSRDNDGPAWLYKPNERE